MLKIKLKKGDPIKVIAGKYKGTKGIIINIIRDKQRVQIEGINIKKHQKPSQNNEGGIKEVPASIHISNVMFTDSKNKNATTKLSYEIKNDEKHRITRKTKNRV